jgi:hypothetical protein
MMFNIFCVALGKSKTLQPCTICVCCDLLLYSKQIATNTTEHRLIDVHFPP